MIVISYTDHLLGDLSPFLEMKFNMVSGFVIDSMHAVFEGAFLRRLKGLAFVIAEGKLSKIQLAEVSRRLKHYELCSTYAGPLKNCGSYKAHVLRQFLYYLLYPVFRDILHPDTLDNLMLLQLSMIQLGGFQKGPVAPHIINKARYNLKRYSAELADLNIPCRYSSHIIIHMPDDVMNFKTGMKI